MREKEAGHVQKEWRRQNVRKKIWFARLFLRPSLGWKLLSPNNNTKIGTSLFCTYFTYFNMRSCRNSHFIIPFFFSLLSPVSSPWGSVVYFSAYDWISLHLFFSFFSFVSFVSFFTLFFQSFLYLFSHSFTHFFQSLLHFFQSFFTFFNPLYTF